jgi:hypothetical protein
MISKGTQALCVGVHWERFSLAPLDDITRCVFRSDVG